MPKSSAPKTVPPKRILILEDHPVFREGMVQIIDNEPDLEVCGTADSAAGAMRVVARSKPDLVLVDISLAGKSGLEFIKDVRKTNRTMKLLVVSMHDEALYADRVLRAGGDGYIMKEESPEEILEAIRDVLEGHIYVSEEVFVNGTRFSARQTRSHEAKLRPLDQLSDSELEFLELLGKGKSKEEIATRLKLSDKSANSLKMRMTKKLNFKSLTDLVRYAVCWVETGKA